MVLGFWPPRLFPSGFAERTMKKSSQAAKGNRLAETYHGILSAVYCPFALSYEIIEWS